MSIGENIKKYRKNMKITQKQLAEKINKQDRTIQKYEKGDIIPPVPVLEEISKVLNCEYVDLAISENDWKRFSEMNEKEEMVKSINNITYINEMYVTPNYIAQFEGDKTFDGITVKYQNKTFTLTEKEYYELVDRIIESVTVNILASKEYKK